MAPQECDSLKDDSVWAPLQKVLTLLIKREHPQMVFYQNLTSWYGNDAADDCYVCHFCGELICWNDGLTGLKLRHHGLNHLKERNLLPFI